MTVKSNTVNTVLGPVAADDLGVVAIHEALLSVLPGAQYAYDITIDRSQVFAAIAAKLKAFRAAGGGTIVDATGMFHGRDVVLLENLSRATGVHIVASTGQGPEAMLGGYFLTPQTNPPTPWPAEKFADMFGREVTEGMVVPRVERRGAAGLVTTAVTETGATATDESLLRGAGRAAKETGVSMTFRAGADAVAELAIVLEEGLAADRVAIADAGAAATKVAEQGAFVITTDPAQVAELASAGHADHVLLAAGGAAVAFGHEATEAAYAPLVSALDGLGPDVARQVLVTNPAALLAIR